MVEPHDKIYPSNLFQAIFRRHMKAAHPQPRKSTKKQTRPLCNAGKSVNQRQNQPRHITLRIHDHVMTKNFHTVIRGVFNQSDCSTQTNWPIAVTTTNHNFTLKRQWPTAVTTSKTNRIFPLANRRANRRDYEYDPS